MCIIEYIYNFNITLYLHSDCIVFAQRLHYIYIDIRTAGNLHSNTVRIPMQIQCNYYANNM